MEVWRPRHGRRALRNQPKAAVMPRRKWSYLAGGRLSNEDLFNLKQLGGWSGRAGAPVHPHGRRRIDRLLWRICPARISPQWAQGTTILVVASDLYNEAPVWYLRLKQAAAARRHADRGQCARDETGTVCEIRCSLCLWGRRSKLSMGLRTSPKLANASAAENLVVSVRLQTVLGWRVHPRPGSCLCRAGQRTRRQAQQRFDRRLAACQ